MKAWLRKWWWISLPVLVIAGAAIAAVTLIARPPQTASAQIVKCVNANAQQFDCWKQHYQQIVQQQSPEAAFVDFKQEYNDNAFVKTNCHQIAHVIGRTAANKFGDLATTYSHGDNFCWSGYYHGAVETIANNIGKDKIEAQLNTVCASFLKSKPYGFDHYNCVHGMGHGLMAVNGDNLFTALKLCDGYEGAWQQESCQSGVFMENVMNEVNPGQHSDYLKADDPLFPCTAVADKYKEQCYMMQTSHALIVEKYDYAKVFQVCSQVATPFDVTCFQSLGRDVSGQSSSNQALTVQRCMLGQTEAARDNCFTGAVKDFLSYYHADTQGLAMCAAIPEKTLSDNCVATAHEYYKTF